MNSRRRENRFNSKSEKEWNQEVCLKYDYTVIMSLVSEGVNPPVVNVRGLYN